MKLSDSGKRIIADFLFLLCSIMESLILTITMVFLFCIRQDLFILALLLLQWFCSHKSKSCFGFPVCTVHPDIALVSPAPLCAHWTCGFASPVCIVHSDTCTYGFNGFCLMFYIDLVLQGSFCFCANNVNFSRMLICGFCFPCNPFSFPSFLVHPHCVFILFSDFAHSSI